MVQEPGSELHVSEAVIGQGARELGLMTRERNRPKESTSRLCRIIKVHQLHAQQETVGRIAKHLGVSRRTIFRDLATLRRLYDELGSDCLDKEQQ